MENFLLKGDALNPLDHDLIVQLRTLRVGEPLPDRLHLARAIGEVPAMLAALRAMKADFDKFGSCANLPHNSTISDILARIDQGEITQ